MEEKPHYVYWYHLPEHVDISKEGYVGVTCDLKHREATHKRYSKSFSIHLRNAFKVYGDKVIKTIVCVTSKEHAYWLESSLRPNENTGWNIAKGGGLPPDCTGRKHSEETKAKIAESNRLAKMNQIYSNPWKGKTGRYTKEQREHLGSFHKGKTISQEQIEITRPKISGGYHYKATKVRLVHKDSEQIHEFDCIKHAAEALGLNYSSLRCQYQEKRTTYNRKGWKILWDKVEE